MVHPLQLCLTVIWLLGRLARLYLIQPDSFCSILMVELSTIAYTRLCLMVMTYMDIMVITKVVDFNYWGKMRLGPDNKIYITKRRQYNLNIDLLSVIYSPGLPVAL